MILFQIQHKDESIKALLKAQEISFENGLTTISDAGISKEQIDLIDELQKTGALKIKKFMQWLIMSNLIRLFFKKWPLQDR